MDKRKLENRNSSLDIIRIFAVFSVVSVHFFLHNGFYSQPVQGLPMFVMVTMRTLFSICVPLFMILTGYLMCNKTLSKKYYKGIISTLIIFALATVACMIFKTIKYGDDFNLVKLLLNTLDFTGANYSWYIEMYIGLFLIAPFLNLAYNKLEKKKHKQVLVFTFVLITIVPTLFNIFNFETEGWWANPTLSDSFQKLFPGWWIGFYPIAYYFTGCYIREYGIRLKTKSLLSLLASALIIFAAFNFYRSYGTTFKTGPYIFWYGIETYILSSLIFVLLSRIKTDRFSDGLKYSLMKISDLALGIYLMSYIFDTIVYEKLNQAVPVMTDRLPYYLITVPIVFICSAFASAILNFISKLIQKAVIFAVSFIKDFRNKYSKITIQNIIFVLLMAAAILFSFIKCFYGFAGNDEAFYLTIPQRFLMGDAPISDEWHLSQLSGFLLMPFTWAYTTITGGTEGIILAARFVYVVFHAFVAITVYTRIKKYGYLSVVAAVLYFIYTPYDIMAMSYNTMGLDFIVLTGVLMGTADCEKKLPLIAAGLCLAASVLCCPYLAIAYVLYGLCVIVHQIIKNKNVCILFKEKIFAPKSFLYFSIGVFILAAVFLAFALSRISINQILEYLPYLMTDPEHPQVGLIHMFLQYVDAIYNSHPLFFIAIDVYGLVLLAMLLDRKRKVHRSVYLIISTAITLFCYVLIQPQLTFSTYNALMFPLIFVGFTSYILCDKKPGALFSSLFILGLIYSVSVCFSSNQRFYVISMACAATNIVSIVFLAQLISEMKQKPDEIEYAVWVKRFSFALVGLMLLIQAGFQITVKAEHCFWEFGGMKSLTAQISTGPAKGIFTTPENKVNYETVCNDLNYYGLKEKDNILFLTGRTYCYLAAEFPYGTLSAWLSESHESNIDRLKTYYSLNTDKTPRYIYIPKDSQWNLTNIYSDAKEAGYSILESEFSYKLEKIN